MQVSRRFRSVSVAVVLLLVTGFMLIVVLGSRQERVPAKDVQVVDLEDTETWLDALREGRYVTFVRQPIGSSDEIPLGLQGLSERDRERLDLLTIETLGTLTKEEQIRFENRLREFADVFLTDLDKLEVGTLRPAEAVFKQTEIITDMLFFRSVAEAVTHGKYFLTAEEYEIEPPHGYQLHATSVLKGGEYVTANVVLRLEEFPGYVEAGRAEAAARQAHLRELADVFNRKSQRERVELIARQAEIRGAGVKTTEDMDFMRTWFPRGVTVDEDILVVHE